MRTVFFIIFGIYFSCSSLAQIQPTIGVQYLKGIKDTIQFNEALKVIDDIKEKEEKLKSLETIAQLIKIGENLDYEFGLGKLYAYRGRILLNNNQLFEATNSYEIAEAYYKKNDHIKELAQVYNDRYVLELNKGNLEKSADYLLEAKMYYEKLADSSGLVIVYSNLGTVHAKLKKYESSEIFFNKAITIRKKIGFLEKIGIVMNNLSYLYLLDNKLGKAKEVIKESLLRNKIDSLHKSVAYSYNIMGEIALYEKDYELARKYYDTTLQISTTIKLNRLANIVKQQLGYLAILSKKYNKAEKLLKEVRIEFIKSKSTELLLKNYKFSSELDSAKGDLHSALVWQAKYQKLSGKKIEELSGKKIEREEDRHRAELAQLRTINKQKIKQQKSESNLYRYRILTIISLIIVSLSLFFTFWIIRTRKQKKKLIIKLNDSNQVKNKLFSIISHDLKNEVFGLESSLNLMKDNEISSNEFETIIPLLADRTHHTSILLNNLLNWSKSQLKELNAKPINFDINEVVTEKFIFFKPKANQKNIKLINTLGSILVYADRDMIAIVIQNLVANAIKFCKSSDSITLFSKEKENHYEIGFADTGVGIDPANINKLFAEETFTTNGTHNESGTGLGLRICKELIELNKGTIRVESTLGEGSTFIISLPKKVVK